MPYSVSPRLTRNSSGGKNSAKRSTRIPTALAAAKWPNSCRMMSTAKPTKARIQLIERASRLVDRGRLQRSTSSGARPDPLGGDLAGLAVGLEERLERAHRAA